MIALGYPLAMGLNEGHEVTKDVRKSRDSHCRDIGATMGASPSTPNLHRTLLERCAVLPTRSGAPWSCSRSLRSRDPEVHQKKGWGHTSTPRGRERS